MPSTAPPVPFHRARARHAGEEAGVPSKEGRQTNREEEDQQRHDQCPGDRVMVGLEGGHRRAQSDDEGADPCGLAASARRPVDPDATMVETHRVHSGDAAPLAHGEKPRREELGSKGEGREAHHGHRPKDEDQDQPRRERDEPEEGEGRRDPDADGFPHVLRRGAALRVVPRPSGPTPTRSTLPLRCQLPGRAVEPLLSAGSGTDSHGIDGHRRRSALAAIAIRRGLPLDPSVHEDPITRSEHDAPQRHRDVRAGRVAMMGRGEIE